MSDLPHEGTVARQFIDAAGLQRLNIIQRTDGSFAYVEEYVDAYFEADALFDEPEVKVWMVRQVSGLFSSLEDAEREARTSTWWLRQQVSQGA